MSALMTREAAVAQVERRKAIAATSPALASISIDLSRAVIEHGIDWTGLRLHPDAPKPPSSPREPPPVEEWVEISPAILQGLSPSPPSCGWDDDVTDMLTWLALVAARMGWLRVTVIRGRPGRWRYEIIPDTELATRAKGRTWPQLMDRLVKPEDFAAIAQNFQEKLQEKKQCPITN